MTLVEVTKFVLIFLVVLVALYDVVAFLLGGQEATFSHVIWTVSARHPVVPFAFGMLMGHLFWRE